jgi:hypothetical protein
MTALTRSSDTVANQIDSTVSTNASERIVGSAYINPTKAFWLDTRQVSGGESAPKLGIANGKEAVLCLTVVMPATQDRKEGESYSIPVNFFFGIREGDTVEIEEKSKIFSLTCCQADSGCEDKIFESMVKKMFMEAYDTFDSNALYVQDNPLRAKEILESMKTEYYPNAVSSRQAPKNAAPTIANEEVSMEAFIRANPGRAREILESMETKAAPAWQDPSSSSSAASGIPEVPAATTSETSTNSVDSAIATPVERISVMARLWPNYATWESAESLSVKCDFPGAVIREKEHLLCLQFKDGAEESEAEVFSLPIDYFFGKKEGDIVEATTQEGKILSLTCQRHDSFHKTFEEEVQRRFMAIYNSLYAKSGANALIEEEKAQWNVVNAQYNKHYASSCVIA